MKKRLTFLSILIALAMYNNPIVIAQEAQPVCKVLLESVSGIYQGDCKNGLAHGKGIALGIDKYEGRFKEGLPNGKGKYTWANGDYFEGNWKAGLKNGKGTLYSASTGKKLVGIWKNDNFEKEIIEPPYRILQNNNISNIIVTEKVGGAPSSVEFVFSRDGMEARDFSSLSINSTSGNIVRSSSYCGIDNVAYPIEISISFSAPNRFNTVMVRYETRFLITKPGIWKVVIKY